MDFFDSLFDLNRDGQMDGTEWAFMDTVTKQAREISRKVNTSNYSREYDDDADAWEKDEWEDLFDWEEE